MSKKRKLRRYPQKYGKKYSSHPAAQAGVSNQEAIEEAKPAPTPELVPTPVLDAVTEEITPVPPAAEKTPEPVVEEVETPEPMAEVAPAPAPEPKARRPRKATAKKTTTRKRTTRKKTTTKE